MPTEPVAGARFNLMAPLENRIQPTSRDGAWPIIVLVAVAVLSSSMANADYETGRAAWDGGRPAEAVSEWRAAANQGDARAMLALGEAYVQGLGVPQDFVEAHMWLNLAAARGDPQAAAARDALAGDMTAEQRAEAQKRAREWVGSRQETAAAKNADEGAGTPPVRAIREAQELLAALGYGTGAADGIWGRGSIAAYRGVGDYGRADPGGAPGHAHGGRGANRRPSVSGSCSCGTGARRCASRRRRG